MPEQKTPHTLILFDVDGCLLWRAQPDATSEALIHYHTDFGLWQHCTQKYGNSQLHLGFGTARQSFELLSQGNTQYGTRNVPFLLRHIQTHLLTLLPHAPIGLMEALLPDAMGNENDGYTLNKMQQHNDHLSAGRGPFFVPQHEPSPIDHYKIVIVFHAIMAFLKQRPADETHKKTTIVLYDDRLEDVLLPLHTFLSKHPALIANTELHLHKYFGGIKESLSPIQGCGAFDPEYRHSIRALLHEAGYPQHTSDIDELNDLPGSMVFFIEFKLLLLNVKHTLETMKNVASEAVPTTISSIQEHISSYIQTINDYVQAPEYRTRLHQGLQNYSQTHASLKSIFPEIASLCPAFSRIEETILCHFKSLDIPCSPTTTPLYGFFPIAEAEVSPCAPTQGFSQST